MPASDSLLLLIFFLAVTACGEAPRPEPGATAEPDPAAVPRDARPATAASGSDTAGLEGADERAGGTVALWFSRGETPVPVERTVDSPGPAAALEALLEGPTPGERARGLSSWFSDSTAGALRSVSQRDGFVVVDFMGLDTLIPGAGSSAGSAMLLSSLDSTVFQFEGVDSVEYRLGGSCEAFWNWLQRGCTVSRRP